MSTTASAVREEAARPRFTAALKHRDLRLLALAFVTDGGASWSYNVVLVAYMFGRTHSAGWVTALVTVRWVVGLLCGGYAGVLADRYDRRSLLIASATVASVVTIGVAMIVGFRAPLWLLLIGAGALTAVCSPTRAASGSLIPEVVPESDLVAANALFALLESVIVVIGPGVGGLLLLTGEPVYGVLINAASFVVAAGFYSLLRVRSHGSAEPGSNILRQWAVGVRTLAHHRKAFVLTGFLILDSAAANAANVLLPALAKHLHGNGTGYSLLLAANAFGGVVVAGLAQKLAGSKRLAILITSAIFLQCVPLWLSVFAGNVPSAMVLQLFSGIGMVIVDVLAFTTLQRDLPRDVLGRVLGTLDMLLLGSAILTSIACSLLYSWLGVGWAFGVIGLGFPALCLFALPVLRRLDAEIAALMARLAPITTILVQLDLFAGAPRSLTEHLAEYTEERTLPAGETIIRQGDASDAFWVLVRGELSISAIRSDGVDVALPDVGAPGYVGELGLLNRTVRSATVTTKTECRLLRIPGTDFSAALEASAPSPSMLDSAGVRHARTAGAPPPTSVAVAD